MAVVEERWIPITFERGINTYDSPSLLDPGELQVLDNLEWAGVGLTPRPAWKNAGATPAHPTNRRGRGIEPSWFEAGIRKLVMATTPTALTTYDLTKTNIADPTAYTTITTFDAAIAITAGFREDPVRFAVGAGRLVSTQPGYPSQQLRKYDGTTAAAIAVSNIAGRAIVYHLSQFWVGGNPTTPTHLRYSAPGDADTWDLANDFVLIGQDDGEPIEDLAVWDRVLVVGKNHGLWYVAGDTPENFVVRPLETRFGAARGRSIVPTEDGVFIVGVDGNCYLWDGGDVRRITKKFRIDPAPALGGGYVSASFVAGKLYVTLSTSGQTVWCYEPAADRWRREKVNSALNTPHDLVSFDDRYLVATMLNPDASRTLLVREEIGPFVAGTGYRDPQPDVSDDAIYTATTGELWPTEGTPRRLPSPAGKATLVSLYVRYRQWTGGTSEPLVATPIVDGAEIGAQAKNFGAKAAAGLYEERRDFGASQEGKNIAVKFSANPVGAESESYAIEEVWAKVLIDKGPR